MPDDQKPGSGEISVNGRLYRLPRRPTVVVCVDGSEPGYIERTAEAGAAPWFAHVLEAGTNLVADSFRIGCIGRLYPENMKGALKAVREVLGEMRVSNGGPALAAE